MEVRLRPLNKNSWAGVTRYKNCFEDLRPYWLKSGLIYTGLSRDEVEELGKELSIDLSHSSAFWKTFKIRVGIEDIYLTPEIDPMDRLKLLFLQGHRRVANSLSDVKMTSKFVLIDSEAEARKANVKLKTKRKAYKEFEKLSSVQISKALRLYGINPNLISAEIAENKLAEIVEQDPLRFLEVWVDNKHRDTQYLLEEAVSKNVVRKNKTVYKYGTEIIGNNVHDAILWLENPNNQDIKMAIMNEVKVKE